MLHNRFNEHSVALSFGLNMGYMLSVVYRNRQHLLYMTLEIQKPWNIGQSLENIGVCASISALT